MGKSTLQNRHVLKILGECSRNRLNYDHLKTKTCHKTTRDAGKKVGQGGPTGANEYLLPWANKYIPEMEGIRDTFCGISWAMPLTVTQMIVFSSQILLAFS